MNIDKRSVYCGIDCSKCDAYIATITNDNELKKKTARLWSKLNNAKILPENINCNGCKYEGIKTIFCTNLCFIRKCAIKNNVDNCKQCAKFNTCADIQKFVKINNL